MSRGFVKEGDQEEPVIVPPRAVLPDGVTNYVTPTGKRLLETELSQLEKELQDVSTKNETDLRREKTWLHGKIKLLKERLASSRVIDPMNQTKDEVRFAAIVSFKTNGQPKKTVRIVGVDEANVAVGKIAFTTPIARALAGAKVGEEISFKLGNEQRKLEIISIEYA